MLLRELFDMSVMRTLYMCRPVENAQEIVDWAQSQGITNVNAADDMHVTIAYSKKEIDWMTFMPSPGSIEIDGGEREMHQFGKATVLTLESDALRDRWQQIIDLGASWDHDDYRPHITISYDFPEGFDLDGVTPYEGKIVLGAERIDTLKDNWADGRETAPERELEDA